MQKQQSATIEKRRAEEKVIMEKLSKKSKSSIQKQLNTSQQLNQIFRIAESKHLKSLGIKNEKGVYANTNIPKNTYLGVYQGVSMNTNQLKKFYKR